jgi:tetraacyldisaccharide 4'-kinase
MADSALVNAWYRGAAWLWLLRPAELVYRLVASLRRAAFRRGVLSVYRCPKPVVVVGNITAGGTGKTPVVITLVSALQQAGLRPGVVSRGYGGRAPEYPVVVEEGSDPGECGDEPLLIHTVTGCPVVVDPDRTRAARTLLAQFDIDLVISDDGLQHYALARDYELVLIDGERGLGNGWCLPAGPLRESATRLESVDAVIYRGGDQQGASFRYEPVGLRRLVDGELRPLDPTHIGSEVYAVAGIGQPEQFFAMLESAGFRLHRRSFPDHHRFVAADFKDMTGLPVIMTEKDAVKCAHLAGPGAWSLGIRVDLPPAIITRVCRLAGHDGVPPG